MSKQQQSTNTTSGYSSRACGDLSVRTQKQAAVNAASSKQK